MSTSTSDTPNIDEKKKNYSGLGSDLESEGMSEKIVSFMKSTFSNLLNILVYFTISSFVLYNCKLAQSNILPTDIDCYPYAESKPIIKKIESNIFETWTSPQQSMKISFDINDDSNSKFVFLDLLLKYKIDPTAGSMTNYLIEIMESLFCFNYSCINVILNLLNNAPEILSVMMGPIITIFIISILTFLNFFYLIYLWFSKMSWFFKQNTNKNVDGQQKWENITFADPSIWLSIAKVIGFFILFIILSCLGLSTIIPIFIILSCLFSSLGYKAEINNKKISVFTITKDLFKYYKVTIMTIFSILVTKSAFSKLGTNQGIFSIIVLLLINFGVISIGIFKPINPENLSALTSYDQATKKCSKTQTSKIMSSFFGGQNSMSQNGGKKFNEKLKKISKMLSRKN